MMTMIPLNHANQCPSTPKDNNAPNGGCSLSPLPILALISDTYISHEYEKVYNSL